jgi:hypothetical protein
MRGLESLAPSGSLATFDKRPRVVHTEVRRGMGDGALIACMLREVLIVWRCRTSAGLVASRWGYRMLHATLCKQEAQWRHIWGVTWLLVIRQLKNWRILHAGLHTNTGGRNSIRCLSHVIAYNTPEIIVISSIRRSRWTIIRKSLDCFKLAWGFRYIMQLETLYGRLYNIECACV